MANGTPFTPALRAEVCRRLADGETLTAICRSDHMCDRQAVYQWARRDEAFAAELEAARNIGADAIADEILDIADDGTNDWMQRKGVEVFNEEAVQRSKLRVYTRFQLLSKWHPKKYGDKVTNEHTGANGGPIVVAATDRDEAL